MANRARVLSGGFIRANVPRVAIAALPVTLPFTETWTVSDAANTLTGDFPWVQGSGGTFGWHVDTGTARLNSSSAIAQWGYLNQDTGTDDVAVTLTYPTYTPGTNTVSVGPLVRMPGTGTFTGYCTVVLTTASVSTLTLYRFLAGGQVQLGSSALITPHAGMTAGVSALANRIRATFDGLVRIDVSDPGIPSGHYVGLQGFINGTSDVKVDTLAVTSSVPHRLIRRHFYGLAPMAGVH